LAVVHKTDDGLEPEIRRARQRSSDRTRLCALTRQHRPVADLIRYVASPDGQIVADLKGNLPGRGVWLLADRQHLLTAMKTGAFQRSLKKTVEIAPEFADQVEHLLTKRAVDALSLANKAGLAVSGFTKVEQAIERGQLAVLLHGTDAKPDGVQKLSPKFLKIQKDRGLPAAIVTTLTISQLSLAIGRPNVVHAGLKTGGSTEAFRDALQRLDAFRLGITETAEPSREQPYERIDG
jgi:uncharacterized protein